MAKVWADVLAEHTYAECAYGLMAFARAGSDERLTPGKIIKHITNASSSNAPLAQDAWGMVYKAIGRSSYYAEEEFAKLPPIVQKAVGSPANLRNMAGDSNFNMGVESSNFIKNYNTCLMRAREEMSIGVNVLQKLEQLNQIGVSHDTE